MRTPGKSVPESERRIKSRRGQSFNAREIRVANMVLNAVPAPLYLSPEDEKARDALRTKFAKMEDSLKLATV